MCFDAPDDVTVLILPSMTRNGHCTAGMLQAVSPAQQARAIMPSCCSCSTCICNVQQFVCQLPGFWLIQVGYPAPRCALASTCGSYAPAQDSAERQASPLLPCSAMGRDLTACGRYAPTPKHQPLSFYTAVRLGDPEFLAKVMSTDPYFVTQARRWWGPQSAGILTLGPPWGTSAHGKQTHCPRLCARSIRPFLHSLSKLRGSSSHQSTACCCWLRRTMVLGRPSTLPPLTASSTW